MINKDNIKNTEKIKTAKEYKLKVIWEKCASTFENKLNLEAKKGNDIIFDTFRVGDEGLYIIIGEYVK
jgi:hypothetical protein